MNFLLVKDRAPSLQQVNLVKVQLELDSTLSQSWMDFETEFKF